MKIRITTLIFLLFFISSFSFAETYNNRFLTEITLKPSENRVIRSGETREYVLEVKDDLGKPLQGSYTLKLQNNRNNENINLIPRENFYYFRDGKVKISFQLFNGGNNEIIIEIDNGRGKKMVQVDVKPATEAFSPGEPGNFDYSWLEPLLPLKKGSNRIRIYLKDRTGNEITEGEYTFRVISQIADFDGRIKEEYFLENSPLPEKGEILQKGTVIPEKGYIEMVLKIPEVMDKNDGISLAFYLENGQAVPQVLKYYSEEDADYEKLTDVGLKNRLVLQINNNRAEVNNFVVYIDAYPRLINNRTMVPLRVVSDFLGIKTEWVPDRNGVSLTGKNKNIFLEIGKSHGIPGLDIPPVIIEGRTYVPLRYIGETFNSLVLWDGAEEKVTILN